jgi:hypothetical protein
MTFFCLMPVATLFVRAEISIMIFMRKVFCENPQNDFLTVEWNTPGKVFHQNHGLPENGTL